MSIRSTIPRAIRFALTFSAFTTVETAVAQQCSAPPPQNSVLYLSSKPQDAATCGLEVVAGRAVPKPDITNAAMTCPDMTAWRLFTQAVQGRFWSQWTTDELMWPSTPLPLCTGSGGACCDPDKPQGGGNCPSFPGDAPANAAATRTLVGQAPSKIHLPGFALRAAERQSLTADGQPGGTDPVSVLVANTREVVFRNRAMYDYLYRNNLYNSDGLVAVYTANAAGIAGAPYRSLGKPGQIVEIDLPIDAVMIKTNWLDAEEAARIGIIDDPDEPHIKTNLLFQDGSGNTAKRRFWLLSFHISSKDVPNWVWSTFEYKTNPGRCDYIGCNDSYGYASLGAKPGQAINFTAPKIQCQAGNSIWDLGGVYQSGALNPQFAGVLDALGIGTQPASDEPQPSDRGWRGYRLKGSQPNFVDSIGQTTRLGNSVTEGGFVNTSSCITCHGRAAVGPARPQPGAGTATPRIRFPALGVFANDLDVSGFLQSANGIPNSDDYFTSRTPPVLAALQTDFIWGFFAASPITAQVAAAPSAERAASAPEPVFLPIRRLVQDAQTRPGP